MQRKTIFLIFGGESSEHEVSIMSARNVYAAMTTDEYNIILCYISKIGEWTIVQSFDQLEQGEPAELLLGKASLRTGSNNTVVDVVFPILHGPNGEDGTVQALAKLWHVPCVGPSLIGAAITMDKLTTKRLLRDGGVPVVDWIEWHTIETQPGYDNAVAKLGSVLFVKPANAGSSIGVSKVTKENEWVGALEEAAKYDSVVLIEKAIDAREIELAVLGDDEVLVSGAGEIVPGDTFYSYDDKYADSSTSKSKIPADINSDTVEQLQYYAKIAYRLTCGRGMARVDFFIDKQTGKIYLNEINSIPGFTNISMYPKLWEYEGMKYPQLVDRLIDNAR